MSAGLTGGRGVGLGAGVDVGPDVTVMAGLLVGAAVVVGVAGGLHALNSMESAARNPTVLMVALVVYFIVNLIPLDL